MALPTLPTLTSICQEALYKAGYTNIPTGVQSRAENQWFDEIKSEIALNIHKNSRRLKSLHKTAFTTTTIGIHRYSNPSDFGTDLNLTLLTGDETGTAQAGALASVTLASTEDVTDDFLIGKYIIMTSGSSINSCSQVYSYNETTKVALVSPDFAVAPSSGDGYMIIDRTKLLTERHVSDFDSISATSLSEPTQFYPIGSNTYGEFILYPNPDAVYGLQLRYYVDLLRIDLASTHMATLYEKWRGMWVQGVYFKALQNIDDPNADKEKKMFYEVVMPSFIEKESFGVDWHDVVQFTVKP